MTIENRAVIRFIEKRLLNCILHLYWVFPIRNNRVLLLNECNFTYSDSPRCIAEYLKNKDSNIEIIFPILKKYVLPDNKIRFVKFQSFLYYYYALTSKVFLTNDGGISYLPFRKEQFVINTWHGGGAFKKIGCSINKTKYYIKDVRITATKTDCFLSSGKMFSKIIEEAYLIPANKIIEVGLPRNDCIVKKIRNKNKLIKEKIGLMNGEKLVLFAPTFRNKSRNTFSENTNPLNDINFKDVISELGKRFGGSWVFGIKFHPSTSHDEIISTNCMDLSSYPDMMELLELCDCLISDYSSVLWDYSLTKKPAFVYAPDLEEFVNETEVYYPLYKWPFSISKNNKELLKNICTFNQEEYKQRCEKYYSDLGGCETGRATDYVCEIIDKKIRY